MTDETIEQRAERLVRNEVYANLGAIVCRLAEKEDDQAVELCIGQPDYESAAIDAGWRYNVSKFTETASYIDAEGVAHLDYDGWQELCEDNRIEPYDREVFEHWSVSNWLAARLEAYGEKVDTDFYGHNVWARTTTGQSITMDGVIQDIARDALASMARLSVAVEA
jgi:hypothetical protein